METGNKLVTGIGVAVAFFAGAALGAAIGMLVAPDSGTENRKKLVHWLKEKREHGKERMLARKARIEAAIEAGKEAYIGDKERLSDVGG